MANAISSPSAVRRYLQAAAENGPEGTSTNAGLTVYRFRMPRAHTWAPLIGSTIQIVTVLSGVTDGLKNAMYLGPTQGLHVPNSSGSCWSTCGDAHVAAFRQSLIGGYMTNGSP